MTEVSDNDPKHVYIDLDAVLDLRLGVLNALHSGFAFEVTRVPNYYLREEDAFHSDALTPGGFTYGRLKQEQFAALAARIPLPKQAANALVTKAISFASHLALAHLKNMIRQGFEIKSEIHVNIWPYMANEKELAALQHAVQQWADERFPVRIISTPYKELTPAEVKQRYFAMIFYDYSRWWNIHDQAIREKPLKKTCLYVPKIYLAGKPEEETLKQLTDRNMDPFDSMTFALGPFVPIQFVPVSIFCANTPINVGLDPF